jgi:hypothetical protein
MQKHTGLPQDGSQSSTEVAPPAAAGKSNYEHASRQRFSIAQASGLNADQVSLFEES